MKYWDITRATPEIDYGNVELTLNMDNSSKKKTLNMDNGFEGNLLTIWMRKEKCSIEYPRAREISLSSSLPITS